MRTQNNTQKVLGATSALLLLALFASTVFAQEQTSSNFRLNDSGFTQFGGYSTTSSFSSFGNGAAMGEGESTSTSFQVASGYLYPADSTPLVTQNWRWYNDASSLTPTVALAAENTAPSSVEYDDPLKLRITVKDTGGANITNLKLRLQYSTSSDFSVGVEYVAEQGECDPTIWCYVDGGGTNNAVIDETVLSDPDACSGGIGNGCGTYNESGTTTSSFLHWANKATEYDFAIKQMTATQSTVYFFRVVDAGTSVPIPLNTGETYPSLTVYGGSLSFSIGGLSSGQSTEGVTTDVTTTPTAVSFGTLPIGSATIAAHRLSVSTNAGVGYKVYTFQRQGLLSSSAREIPPVATTNESPAGWTSACAATSTGCYGYHTGEDVLDGGSTRFAANDSFARFTGELAEVAYGSGPASASTTDIVYKVEVKDSQDAGAYESAIVYIVTPVF